MCFICQINLYWRYTKFKPYSDFMLAKPTCETGCPYNIAYVCGSDGVTYTNECTMRAESCLAGKPNVRKAYDGKCGSGGRLCNNLFFILIRLNILLINSFFLICRHGR